ncbi:MAG: glycosyltransferase [Rubrobacteraceae bacterium]
MSVVVAARDEERAIGEGVDSLLEQDYPGRLDVIAVDDCSTDRTGEILAALAGRRPELRVIHVKDLPEGWLGKNHALHVGASASNGEWLLFTDADVRFSPRCLRLAVAYAVRSGADHLVLFPEIVSGGVLLRSFVASFTLAFMVYQRPWRVRDPRARDHLGVGAFNLLRREVYDEVGGHRKIALRPDDDVRLGKLVKRGGFMQEVAFGTGLLDVEWHSSVGGAIKGLTKSIFAGLDYRPELVALSAPLFFLTNVLPFPAALLTGGAAQKLSGLNVLLIFAVYACQGRYSGSRLPLWYAALHPVGAGLLTYAVVRSAVVVLAGGGLEWRGTRYPLELLKSNRV